jgi:hypothetical protein
MNETTILQRIRLAIGRIPGLRMFRQNVGKAWMGQVIKQTPEYIVLKNPRFVSFGLHPGSADLIGWKSVTITHDMVGKTVAVFASVEVKTPTGAVKTDQANWRAQVEEAGGIAIVARSEQDALAGLTSRRLRADHPL